LYSQSHSEWIEISFKYLNDNHLDSAEVALTNALRAEPDNPLNAFLFHNLGTIQRRLGKNKDALQSYSLALRRYPKNKTFLSDRASLNAETDDYVTALIDYNTLLEEEPNNEEALYQRGLVNIELKNFESAESDFNRMLELSPMSFYARLGLATLYKVEKRYDEAEGIYIYLETKEPNHPEIYAGRAEIYLLKEKAGRALTEINKAIRWSETENPYFYIIRSRAKLLMREKDSAAEDIRKAMSLGYDAKEAEILLRLTK
jgi:tetratricopeptide (TPR) repeat protein